MMKFIAVTTFTLLAAAPATAAVVYSEDFDSYTPALNFAAFNPPGQVTDGTVDVVASGTFSIDCIGGTGNCLDLDGSTGNSGIFSFTVDLAAGEYRLTFAYSGNQRGGASDTLFAELDIGGSIVSDSILLAPSAPFALVDFVFDMTSAGSFTMSLWTDSNDNIGPIIDSILLESLGAEVPEPAMLGLLGLGLLGIGAARRRR